MGLAALAALGAATAGASKTDEHRTEVHFVLRPDASVTADDLPGTLEALKSDGTLVQTVIGVLRNRTMLRRAAADADVTLTPDYTVDSTAQPGSTLIDSTITGPDRAVLGRLAASYASEASTFVTSSYPAYVLERLSTEAASGGTGPGTGQVVILALLLGGALGVILVAAELRLEPQIQRISARRAAERAARPRRAEPEEETLEAAPEPEAKRSPERESDQGWPAPKPVVRPRAQARREPELLPDRKIARRPEPAAAEREREPEPERVPKAEPERVPKAEPEREAERPAASEPEPAAKPEREREPQRTAAEAPPEPAPEPAIESAPEPAAQPEPRRPEPNGRPEPGWRRQAAGALPPGARPPGARPPGSRPQASPRPMTGPGPPRWRPRPPRHEDGD